ncbi:MAG: hypothetical protein J5973_09950 [Eubacterium sp.]|nr:hypothetical protein [Eubacterium sp.]
MRSTEEQIHEVLKRADVVKENRSIRRRLLSESALAAVFLALLITVLHFLPRLSGAAPGPAGIQYGSLLLVSPCMGAVLAAAAAAAFVFCIVRLCMGWKYLKKKERKDP